MPDGRGRTFGNEECYFFEVYETVEEPQVGPCLDRLVRGTLEGRGRTWRNCGRDRCVLVRILI